MDVAKALKDNSSLAKIRAAIKQYGLTFKGKAVSDAQAKALKALDPFLGVDKCNEAYNLTESVCPEVMDSTILMRIAQLSSARGAGSNPDQPCAKVDRPWAMLPRNRQK